MAPVFRLLAPLVLPFIPVASLGQEPDPLSTGAVDRAEPRRPSIDYEFVGRLECKADIGTIATTAILINDSRTVLTAAHFNFDEDSDRTIGPDRCRFFMRGPNNGIGFESQIEELARGGDHTLNAFTSSTDWALLRLTTAAPPYAKPIDTGSGYDGNEATNVWFVDYASSHLNRSRQSAGQACFAEPIEHRFMLIAHQCETAPGSSGGALVAQIDGTPTLVAIHTGRAKGKGIAIRIGGVLARSIDKYAAREKRL